MIFWRQNLWQKIWSFQFSRFLLIGTVNTIGDFCIVNLLAHLLQTYQGFLLVAINSISFITVVSFSFFMNKNWTFIRTKGQDQAGEKKYFLFVMVTLIGLFLNNSIVYLLTTVVGPQYQLSQIIWLNISKVFATSVILFWNFFNYKYLVFRIKS